MSITTIADIRKKYPDYNDLSDQELADKLYTKHYSDMPKNDFYQKVGFSLTQPQPQATDWQSMAMAPQQQMMHADPKEQAKVLRLASAVGAGWALPEFIAPILETVAPETATAIGSYIGGLSKPLSMGTKILQHIGKDIVGGATAGAIAPGDEGVGTRALEGGLAGAVIGTPLSIASSIYSVGTPLVRAAMTGALGGTAGYFAGNKVGHPDVGAAIGALMGGKLGLGKTGYSKLAALNTIGKSSPEQIETAIKRGEESKKAGIPLTMLEAIGTPKAGKQLSNLGQTTESANAMYNFGLARQKQEQDVLSRFLENISPSSSLGSNSRQIGEDVSKNIEQKLYQKAKASNPPVNSMPAINYIFRNLPGSKGSVKSNLINALKLFREYPGKDVDMSLSGLHGTQQALQEMMENPAQTSAGKTSMRHLSKIKNTLLDAMDEASPEYKEARKMAHARLTREGLENDLKGNELTAENFNKYILSKPKKYNNLYNNLKDKNDLLSETPLQRQLRAMKGTFGYLIPPINAKVANTIGKEGEPGLPTLHGSLMDYLTNSFSGKYHNAMADLNLHPEWHKEKDILKEMLDKHQKALHISHKTQKAINLAHLVSENTQ